MEGVKIEQVTANPQLSELEEWVLRCYNRIENLCLELALLNVRDQQPQDDLEIVTSTGIVDAHNELLKAKAAFQIRKNIVESILIANPLLESAQADTSESVSDRRLSPLLRRRDELSLCLTKLAKKEEKMMAELLEKEADNIRIARENTNLAATMLELAEKGRYPQHHSSFEDTAVQKEIFAMESMLYASRQKWKMMKETASAAVAGSGVAWARDPELLLLVLDDE
ncbi:BgTH12-07254 [Blumeria graminis f. sp. triticale]|uniref:BgTH12-07254 n=1 Tax=Blumeria graminis f. sp. triticale TaxID=1689686 RepID=A0A9W4D8U0_BLUGR|nr:BgTH12-07254 [Blumeria graminis f. sp. triticale]